MSVVPLPEADVDVCPSCAGIWVDWFDGEIGAVARRVRGATEDQAVPVPLSSMRNEVVATGGCPRCHGVQLVVERYVLQYQSGATAGAGRAGRRVDKVEKHETGAELLRCEHCAGSFVSATSADLLASLPPEEGAPPSEAARVLEPLPWQKFVAVVKAIFGVG
jgi:Zn-finger nucleic acid-binding protein